MSFTGTVYITLERGLEEKYALQFVMFSLNCSLGGMSNRLTNKQTWRLGGELETTIWPYHE